MEARRRKIGGFFLGSTLLGLLDFDRFSRGATSGKIFPISSQLDRLGISDHLMIVFDAIFPS